MLGTYLLAYLVTVGIEVPVVAALYPGQRKRMAVVCAVTTTLTHLAMHFVLTRFVRSHDQFLLIGEAGALAVEAAVYTFAAHPRDVGRALVASALANGLSYGAGLLLFRWLAG